MQFVVTYLFYLFIPEIGIMGLEIQTTSNCSMTEMESSLAEKFIAGDRFVKAMQDLYAMETPWCMIPPMSPAT